MMCVPPLHDPDKALGCACLQCASAGSAKEEHDVGETGKSESARPAVE